MRTARPTIGEHADGQCLSAGRFAQPFHRRLCFIRKVLPSRHDTLPLRHHLAVSKTEQPSDINQRAMLKEGLEVSATSKPPCGAKHRGFQLLAHPLGLPVHIRVGVSGRAARHEQRGRTRRGQLCVFAAGRRSHSTATATVWLCGALREGVPSKRGCRLFGPRADGRGARQVCADLSSGRISYNLFLNLRHARTRYRSGSIAAHGSAALALRLSFPDGAGW